MSAAFPVAGCGFPNKSSSVPWVLPPCVRFLISQLPTTARGARLAHDVGFSHMLFVILSFFLSSYKDSEKRVGEGETLQVFEAT